MIEVIPTNLEAGTRESLRVGGELIEQSPSTYSLYLYDNSVDADKFYLIYVYSEDVFHKVASQTWDDFSQIFVSMDLYDGAIEINNDLIPNRTRSIRFDVEAEEISSVQISRVIEVSVEHSYANDEQAIAYCATFRRIMIDGYNAECIFSTNPFRLRILTELPFVLDEPVQDLVSHLDKVIEQVDGQARVALESGKQTSEDSVTVRFNFPPSVRTYCEQYLVYFGEFLKNIGVGATANLTHDANEVLFTVTPDNPEQALDKIRQALGLYLNLPSSPVASPMPNMTGSFEVQALELQVHNLRGQFALVNLAAQQQAATIQAHETTIRNQQWVITDLVQRQQPVQIIMPSVLTESIVSEPIAPKEAKAEEGDVKIMHGLVTIKPVTILEKFGVTFDVPRLFRYMREYMADPDWIEITAKDTDDRY